VGAAFFYHLTESPLEQTLAMLLGKAGQAGWRCAVLGSSQERMVWLDQRLWLGAGDAFLAHGLAGGTNDADQPILLTTKVDFPNGATCLMTVDGADVEPDFVTTMERVCILFDGNDMDAVDKARAQWKTLTDAGCSAQYWAQDNGSWTKKAER